MTFLSQVKNDLIYTFLFKRVHNFKQIKFKSDLLQMIENL